MDDRVTREAYGLMLAAIDGDEARLHALISGLDVTGAAALIEWLAFFGATLLGEHCGQDARAVLQANALRLAAS